MPKELNLLSRLLNAKQFLESISDGEGVNSSEPFVGSFRKVIINVCMRLKPEFANDVINIQVTGYRLQFEGTVVLQAAKAFPTLEQFFKEGRVRIVMFFYIAVRSCIYQQFGCDGNAIILFKHIQKFETVLNKCAY